MGHAAKIYGGRTFLRGREVGTGKVKRRNTLFGAGKKGRSPREKERSQSGIVLGMSTGKRMTIDSNNTTAGGLRRAQEGGQSPKGG